MEQNKDIINETGAMEKIGIVDEPLEKKGKDSLKIKKYSNALVSFIKNSMTPMTIGIQGSWGSGKTSLLNTIYAQLDDANEHEESKDFKVIWINSWENSLMATPEEALIKIINEIINGLNEVDPSLTNVKKVKEAATTAAKGILRVGAGILGGAAGSEVVTEVLESSNSIKQLREELSRLVHAIRESESQRVDKIVIFVDDLDRVDPPEAVKILELLKNIFNIPGCVFVLAIDYDVVIKGLKDKFGERTPENEYEFRAFFDKIIQLPFLMPIQNYDIGNYVNDLLRQIGFQDENEIDVDFVNKVVDNTIVVVRLHQFDHLEQGPDFDLEPRLLLQFPAQCILESLSEFDPTSRKRPCALSRRTSATNEAHTHSAFGTWREYHPSHSKNRFLLRGLRHQRVRLPRLRWAIASVSPSSVRGNIGYTAPSSRTV